MQILKYLETKIDSFLNQTPIYKVVAYSLLLIVLAAFVESFFGILSYSPISLLQSLIIILFVTLTTNFLFAKSLKLPFQIESTLITALIIFLILLPVESTETILAAIIASFVAIASKYILVARNTHIFNPAAIGIFAVTFLGFFFNLSFAFWWVGSLYLLPVVLVTALLVVRKTRKTGLFFASILAALVGTIIQSYFNDFNFLTLVYQTFISGPIIFFAAFMLTEPHTIAKNKNQQIFYAFFIILLPTLFAFTNLFHISPELSLLVGNLLSFVVSNRKRYILKLVEINKLSDDQNEYIFESSKNEIFNFKAGEYMEWVLPHDKADLRGLRRYFTICSAPGSDKISFATKFPQANESSFKKALKNIKVGDTMFANQLSGDFLLNDYRNKNIIMIAGGIGITPFISQIRDLLNKNENKKQELSLALFYCANTNKDIVFVDELKKANLDLKLKVVCVVSNPSEESKHTEFFYETGFMTKEILNKYTQNMNNLYYISGPGMMVSIMQKMLIENKANNKNIHTDFFPGF